ncbi:MAG: hypothetical protein ACLP1X_12110 [Polyangiaceae bacterium]
MAKPRRSGAIERIGPGGIEPTDSGVTLPIDAYVRERLTRDYEEAAIARVQTKAGATKDLHGPLAVIRDPKTNRLRCVVATSDDELSALITEAREQEGGFAIDTVLLPKPDDETLQRLTTARTSFLSPAPARLPARARELPPRARDIASRARVAEEAPPASVRLLASRGGGLSEGRVRGLASLEAGEDDDDGARPGRGAHRRSTREE